MVRQQAQNPHNFVNCEICDDLEYHLNLLKCFETLKLVQIVLCKIAR